MGSRPMKTAEGGAASLKNHVDKRNKSERGRAETISHLRFTAE